MTDAVIEKDVATTDTTTQATTADTTADVGKTAETTAVADTKVADQKATDTSKTDEPAPVAQKWPTTWREEMAGTLADTATDDEKAEHSKLLKRLQRFNSPADAAKAIREQDKLISSGALKKALPKNATPEQIAEWRKDNGVPEAADKYDLTLPDGLVLGDNDKPVVSEIIKDLHGVNASNDVVKTMLSSYLKQREAQVQQVIERNEAAKKDVEDSLRAEWGQDYRTNVAGIESLLGHADSSVVEAISQARMPDGTAMLNRPEVVRWLAGHARELGFVGATVVPNGGDISKSVGDELDALNKQMATDIDAWAKNEKGQKRWLELKETQMRLDKRK